MVEKSLKRFLASQRTGTLDSVGQFTLSPAEALEKIGRYQLSSRGLWLVKVAQAGVNLGATEITYTFERESAQIRFYGSAPVDGQELGRALLSGELPAETWKLHLVTGLRALMAQNPRHLSWLDSAKRTTTIGDDGVCKRVSAQTASQDQGASLVIRAQLPPPGGLLRCLAPPTFDHALLARLCQLCHVPIRVNGACVSRRLPPRRSRFSRDSETIVMVLNGFGNNLPLVVTNIDDIVVPLSTLPNPRLEPYKVGVLAVLFRSAFVASPKSHCYWIKDGALLEPRPFRFDFQSRTRARYGLNLYFDGSQAIVDASQFSLATPDINWLALQSHLRKLVSQMNLAIRPHRQVGWTPQDRAQEDRRALLDAIDWMRF
jgi:hypothetical protein